MTKTIRELLPKKKPKTKTVQARISEDLVFDVKKIMKQEGLKWPYVLTACLERFRQEMRK